MRRAPRCPLWTLDVATGAIIDWNIPAARLCGWKRGAVRRPFGELSKLLTAVGPKPVKGVTLANIIRLARTRRGGAGLDARLRRTGARQRYLTLQALMTGGERRRESILLMAGFRRSVPDDDAGSGVLSAILGHELNNIAVPLEGFTDLAARSARGNATVKLCLEETRIAIGRITALAYELESLGETDSHLMDVSIGECMPGAAGAGSGPVCNIDWRCSPATAIAADRLQAQRAIRALIRAATGAVSRSVSRPVLTVSRDSHRGVRCVSCDARVSRRDGYVSAHAGHSCPVSGEGLRRPFGPRRGGATTLPLTLAVLVHCAHRAGGHLVRDKASGSLSLAFPTA